MSGARKKGLAYVILLGVGFLTVYPLIRLSLVTFKTNQEPFGKLSLWPEELSLDGIINGQKRSGQFTYTMFYKNTFLTVIPVAIFMVLSTGIVAYGFTRFSFPCKKILFLLMVSTLMLLDSIITTPRYALFHKFGWMDTYMLFWTSGLLACYPFSIFMQVQFLRGIPRELDESTCADRCNPFMTYVKILFPLMEPTVFSVIIFQFLWRRDNYFNNLIRTSSVKKYTLFPALKMSIDGTGAVTQWNQVLDMPSLSMIPPTLLYFSAWDHSVKGITAGGAEG